MTKALPAFLLAVMLILTVAWFALVSAEPATVIPANHRAVIVVQGETMPVPGEAQPVKALDLAGWEALGWTVQAAPGLSIPDDCQLYVVQGDAYAICNGPRRVWVAGGDNTNVIVEER
jgi:hypothetical protein